MIHLPALLCCLLGFLALALAVERQQDDVFGRLLSPRMTRLLRLAGACALVAALWLLVAAQGWGLGLVSYSGHTSLAAGVVYVSLVVGNRVRER
jgi:TRAP-type C4-dicarboxylate transport system permease small subunit